MATRRSFHYLILTGMSLVLFFLHLGGASLWDVDEGRNATASFEMMDAGKYIVPTFNSQLRDDKPALLYWLQIFAYNLFGVNEFAARFPSALAALATVLLCYELARAMFGVRTGFWAGCLVATTPMLCGAARFSNPDALLNCFTVLTLTLFWIGQRWSPALWFASMGVSVGFALLAKGPVGLVLPGGVIFLYLLWEGKLRLLWNRQIGQGILTSFLVAAPWYIWVAVETKGEFIRGFLFKHNVGRALNPMENHSGFPGFYLFVIIVGTLPWSIFLFLTVWYAFWSAWNKAPQRWQSAWDKAVDRDVAPGHTSSSVYRFLATWCLLYLVFFSAAATKLPNYVLPVVVPFCILTGRFLERWRLGTIEPPRGWLYLSFASLALLGIGLSAGILVASGTVSLPALRGRIFPDIAPWAWMGLLPVAGALLGFWLLHTARNAPRSFGERGWGTRRRSQWITALVLGALAFWGPLAAWANAAFNHYKAARPLVQLTGADERDQEILIGGYKVDHLASLNFYVQRNILHHKTEEDAFTFLRYPLKVYLFLPAQTWESWQDRIPANCRLLSRHPDLYRRDEMVVVTNR